MSFEIENGILKEYTGEPDVTEITIPEGVTSIGTFAFSGCTELTALTIPEGVKNIDPLAFSECKSLKEITLPDSIRSLSWLAINETCQYIRFQGMKFRNFSEMLSFDFDENDDEGSGLWQDVLTMLIEKQYCAEIKKHIKYPILWQAFYQKEDAELSAYIAEHFEEMFSFAIKRGIIEAVERVCEQGKWLTSENIDKFIEFAITQKQTEIQLLLLNYKNETIGYKENPFKL